jgi:hypothetical protein
MDFEEIELSLARHNARLAKHLTQQLKVAVEWCRQHPGLNRDVVVGNVSQWGHQQISSEGNLSLNWIWAAAVQQAFLSA